MIFRILVGALAVFFLALALLVGCSGDVQVHGMPSEIRLTTGCGDPVDASE